MSSVCIIDTTVFLNLLNVPRRNERREEIVQDFELFVDLGATFILPMATIIETGNHIAQCGNGGLRRPTAQRFCEAVKEAFSGDAPYQMSEFPSTAELLTWIEEFPNHAGRSKSADKVNEGTSFGDLSIIEEYNKCLSRFPSREVFIWSLDSDLTCYRRSPLV